MTRLLATNSFTAERTWHCRRKHLSRVVSHLRPGFSEIALFPPRIVWDFTLWTDCQIFFLSSHKQLVSNSFFFQTTKRIPKVEFKLNLEAIPHRFFSPNNHLSDLLTELLAASIFIMLFRAKHSREKNNLCCLAWSPTEIDKTEANTLGLADKHLHALCSYIPILCSALWMANDAIGSCDASWE